MRLSIPRFWSGLAGGVGLSFMNPCPGFGGESFEHPNVVFIVLDSARADHFSAYGYGKKTTPRMDAISAAGALFLNNFSPGSSTQESVPRIFSSRYFSTQVFSEYGGSGARVENPETVFLGNDAQQIFLPQVLSLSGYRTALFSDHSFLSDKNFFVRLFDEHYHFKLKEEEVIFSRLIGWLKINKTRKFFVYLHILSPHWSAGSGWNRWPQYDGRRPRRRYEELLGDISADVFKSLNVKDRESTGEFTPDELRTYRGVYDNNLRILDDQVGRLYDALNELGLGRKTIVIISADHGENLGEYGRTSHGGPPRDSVTRVPLIIVYPPKIRPGTKIQGLTQSIDIMPTILELSGVKPPPQKTMDGVSLLRVIEHPSRNRKAVFWENAVRTPAYKCMQTKGGVALYDLRTDPEEGVNIAPREPELAKELLRRKSRALDRFRKRFLLAKRSGPPDFAFSYPMYEFSMSPKAEVIKVINEKPMSTHVLNEAPAPWVLNVDGRAYGLHRSSRRDSSPLTLSAPVPSGSYRVSMWLRCDGRIELKELGLRFRFNPNFEFLPALKKTNTQAIGHVSYFSCELGEAIVTNDRFFVAIQLPPLRENAPSAPRCMLRRVKFEPLDGRGNSLDLAAQSQSSVSRGKILEVGYW